MTGFIGGVDVSLYQGEIEFPKLKAANVKFVYVRAAAGDVADAMAKQNCRRAKRNNLPFGVYLYWKPEVPAARQMRLLSLAHREFGATMVPQIDVEHDGGLPPRTIRKRLNKFIDQVEDELLCTPTIYTGAWFWNLHVREKGLSRCPLWAAHYIHPTVEAYKADRIPKDADQWGAYAIERVDPMPVIGWKQWSIWQFAAVNNRVGKRLGMSSLDVDVNVMRSEHWDRFML